MLSVMSESGNSSVRVMGGVRHRRNSSIELLRILSMMGIVAFHSVHENRFDVLGQGLSVNKLWLELVLNPLGNVGVVVFFSISAWFLCDAEASVRGSLRRIWILERELLFWSLTILLVLLVSPIRPSGKAALITLVKSFLPVSTAMWWYPTSYAVFLLLLPFLIAGLRGLGGRRHGQLAVVCFIMWSVLGGLVPHVDFDMTRMNVMGFVYLFILVSYWKWYRKPLTTRQACGMIVSGVAVIPVFVLGPALLTQLTGMAKGWQMGIVNAVNMLPMVLIGFGVFALAERHPTSNRVVNWIAPSAFATYLITSHPVVKEWIWSEPFNLGPIYHNPWLPLISVAIVLAVFASCTALDLVRRGLFHLTVDRHPGRWFDRAYGRIIASRIAARVRSWMDVQD